MKENEPYLLAAGIACLALTPVVPFMIIPGTLAGIAVAIKANDYINDLHNKIDWRVLGIVNKSDHVPVLINHTDDTYVYSLPNGISIDDIDKKHAAIENIFKHKVNIYLCNNYNVVISLAESKETEYKDIYKLDIKKLPKGMRLALGFTKEGKAIELDLSGTELHTGVFGANGSGKSVCLNVLIVQLILKDVHLYLIDLKGGVEFGIYRRYANLKGFAKSTNEAIRLLTDAQKLMEERYNILFEKECKSYKDCKDMYPVVVVIDEYNNLMGVKDAQNLLFDLLSRARAANIIIILSTQNPTKDVVPGLIKANIKNTISFKVGTQVASEIALSEKGNYTAFTDLKNKGEGILRASGILVQFKGYYLTDSEIRSYIGHKLTRTEELKKEPKKENSKEDIKKIGELI